MTPATPEIQPLREAIARAIVTFRDIGSGVLTTGASVYASIAAKELQQALDEELRYRDLAPEPPDRDWEVCRSTLGEHKVWIAYGCTEDFGGKPMAPEVCAVYLSGEWVSELRWSFSVRQITEWEAAALAHVRTCTREAA